MEAKLIYYLCDKNTGEIIGDENASPMLYLTFEAAKEAYDGFSEKDRKELDIAATHAFN